LHRNCLLKHVIEGKEEGTEDEADTVSSYWITKEMRRNWKLKEELNYTHWITCLDKVMNL